MKLEHHEPDMEVDRMYCPSTNEVIFAPYYEEVNEAADAFIAYWHGEVLTEPEIKDPKLKSDWQEFYEKMDEEDYDLWQSVEDFLNKYDNPAWKVMECIFYGMACGPTQTTVYYVVKADTVIEEDPEPRENPYDNMTEEEIEEDIIAKQIRALMGKGNKEF